MDKREIEYAVISNCINTLSVVCAGDRNKIIDILTGYLFDEEEAGSIKRSSGKFKINLNLDNQPNK